MRPVNLAAIFVVLVATSALTAARPHSRHKRSGISDQRLAELETLLALSRMKGNVVTVPVAMGVVDPRRIGKRKRSFNLYERNEDVTDVFDEVEPELIQRFLQPSQTHVLTDMDDEDDFD